jgi:hypothetical protein
MPKGIEPERFEELCIESVFVQKALLNLLDSKGIITKAELLKEMNELKCKEKNQRS